MPTTLSPTDISNIALARIGAQAINTLSDQTNASSIACNTCFQLAYLVVSRAARWNCLMNTAVLTQVPQTPLPGTQGGPPQNYTNWQPNTYYAAGVYLNYSGAYYLVVNGYTSSNSFATDLASGNIVAYNSNGPSPVAAVPWLPNTNYLVGTFLTYGGYYYQVDFTYTSTNNFTNDLTTGALTQTNLPTTQPFFPPDGSSYASGWQYSYQLPSNFQLLVELNGNTYWGGIGWGSGTTSNYQIMGSLLFCNTPQAVIQYVQNVPDTTQFDSLFTEALTFKLAAMISTKLRQDGGAMEAAMEQEYKVIMREARTKNAGEAQPRRWNPIGSSIFNASRYGGING